MPYHRQSGATSTPVTTEATIAAKPPATHDRLIAAGLTLFASHGFDGVSTRQLATRAGVNLSAILYYFEGKAGLYDAVVARAAELLIDPIRAELDRATALIATGPTPAAARGAIVKLVDRVAEVIVGDAPDGAEATRFIIREVMAPGSAPDPLRIRMMEPLSGCLTRLLAIAQSLPAEDTRPRLQATALMGEMLIFRLFHNTPYDAGASSEAVRGVLRANAAAIAGGGRDAEGEPSSGAAAAHPDHPHRTNSV